MPICHADIYVAKSVPASIGFIIENDIEKYLYLVGGVNIMGFTVAGRGGGI